MMTSMNVIQVIVDYKKGTMNWKDKIDKAHKGQTGFFKEVGNNMKPNLLISGSGGETSSFMTEWLIENKLNDFNKVAVCFANTSKEKEETLQFFHKLHSKYNIPVFMIEATFDGLRGIGYRQVNFEDLKRDGEVFEDMIKCYGLPNKAYPHCSRELKTQPITRFAKEFFGEEGYTTAIGLRADEIDRINAKWKENKFYYPLIADVYTTKPHVNKFWNDQVFRLDLKGYEGNCDMCWKKSNRKLLTLILENPSQIDWWNEMELKYGDFVPEHRKRKEIDGKLTFFRQNLSAIDLIEMSKELKVKATDDSIDYNIQSTLWGYDLDTSNGCEESCEAF